MLSSQNQYSGANKNIPNNNMTQSTQPKTISTKEKTTGYSEQ